MLNLTSSMAVAHVPPGRVGVEAARGHWCTSVWPTRKRAGRTAPLVGRPRDRRRRLRLPHHRVGRVDRRGTARTQGRAHRRRERRRSGAACACAGTPGHGSMPFGADNALVRAAEVVTRLAEYRPAAAINDVWRPLRRRARSARRRARRASSTPPRSGTRAPVGRSALAKLAHACTHTTFSPNVVHGGVKTNVIPDEVVIDVDIRTLPGQTGTDVEAMLAEALGRWPRGGGRGVAGATQHAEPDARPRCGTRCSAWSRRRYPRSSLLPGSPWAVPTRVLPQRRHHGLRLRLVLAEI